MKILVLQLARFGDIYQTWPALKSLRRSYPEATIDLLVRDRFEAATRGLDAISAARVFPVKQILKPIWDSDDGLDDSLKLIENCLSELVDQSYDLVINLSFSPLSSYVTRRVSGGDPQRVVGYTRHSDGFFDVPDDTSSYFYSQVGANSYNRVHVIDMFAGVCGVELIPEDFQSEVMPSQSLDYPDAIVVHVAASEASKSMTQQSLISLVQGLTDRRSNPVVLVGGPEDETVGSSVQDAVSSPQLINLVGQLPLEDHFSLIKNSALLIAPDSVMVHMASLVSTKTLNVTFPSVNFWETGPLASGSRALWYRSPDEVDVQQIIDQATTMLEGQPAIQPVILREDNGLSRFQLRGFRLDDYAWQLTQALYVGAPFPASKRSEIALGIQRIFEACELAQQQLEQVRQNPQKGTALDILLEADEIFHQVARFVPEVRPLVDWFLTQKVRISPAELQTVFDQTAKTYDELALVCRALLAEENKSKDYFL